jgi:hypothetical protein
MKKPVLSIDEPEPKKAQRADRPPTEGFTVIVDKHFKSDFETFDAAEASGRILKSTYIRCFRSKSMAPQLGAGLY